MLMFSKFWSRGKANISLKKKKKECNDFTEKILGFAHSKDRTYGEGEIDDALCRCHKVSPWGLQSQTKLELLSLREFGMTLNGSYTKF